MVGIKRTRPRQESVDLDVESASSHLRHDKSAARKRSRLTPLDDDDDVSIGSSPHPSRNTQQDEDEEDSDLSDREVEARVAQRQRFRENVQNRAAEMGIIEEVHCRNFMCHSNLTIKLGPLINFIIGHNGSGKSAVLTALQLCLGGKATSTNRGQSLKNFIKTGAEQATLAVRIKNQGEAAYQPELYGKTIIVERIFSRAGTSGFKIKNQDGKIISSRKSDLEDILDALALMMDNPMNVLTQDMARQFLNSSNPTEKYRFFYQGTHLEQLDSDYRILQESLEQNQAQAWTLRDTAEAAEKLYKEAEKKAQLAERAETLTEHYKALSRQMAWIQVRDEEDKLAAVEADIRKQDSVIEERKAMCEQLEARLADYVQARDDAKEALDAIKAESTTKDEERRTVKDQFEEVKKKLGEIMSQQRDIKTEVDSARKNAQRLRMSIDAEKEKIARADNGRHAQTMNDIQAAEDQLATLRDEVQQKSSESRTFDTAVRDASDELKEAQSVFESSSTGVKNVEQRIRGFENERGDWRKAYSPKLPTLLRAIDNENRFKEKPVGPLGRYIRLTQPKWADILEKSSGGSLNAFVVTSKADQALLSDLMRRTSYDAQILVTSSRRLDTTGNEPPEEYDTWLRALKFDNDLVRNCMIINHGIEKTLLEESTEKARDMISARIPNVQRIFAMNPVPDRLGGKWGQTYMLTGGGGESQSPIQPWNGGARMQSDIESQIGLERDKLARLKSSHQANEANHREAQNKLTRAKQAVVRHQRQMKDLNVSAERAEDEVQRLKNQLEEDTPQEQELERLEVELREAQETQQQYEGQYGDCVLERDRLNAEQRPIKDKLNEIQNDLTSQAERIKAAEKALHKAEDNRSAKVLELNNSHEIVKDAEEHRARLEQEHATQSNTVTSFTAQAQSVSGRVAIDPEETTDSLEAKLKRMEREQARQREELGGDKEELILKKLNAKNYYDERQRAYDNLRLVVDTLKSSLQNRQKRWEMFRDKIVARAAGHFGYLLSNRNFRGDLIISHPDRTLKINVQPDAASKSSRGRETKTLSGGEKSFSTICLLLALWDAMGSPVRCLDEFDVFMDQVNRDISMGMMIEAARTSVSKQFVLITPQSMNNVQLGDDVKIHKMLDPERGQTTLSQFVGTQR